MNSLIIYVLYAAALWTGTPLERRTPPARVGLRAPLTAHLCLPEPSAPPHHSVGCGTSEVASDVPQASRA